MEESLYFRFGKYIEGVTPYNLGASASGFAKFDQKWRVRN